jgi:hypothetical protein
VKVIVSKLIEAASGEAAERRLDDMLRIAAATGQTLDSVVLVLGQSDETFFRAVSDNPSILPRYMKSSVKP